MINHKGVYFTYALVTIINVCSDHQSYFLKNTIILGVARILVWDILSACGLILTIIRCTVIKLKKQVNI